MKIEKQEQRVAAALIEIGEVFEVNNMYYIRTDLKEDDSIVAVGLADGIIRTLKLDAIVNRVRVKMVVEW